MTRSILKATTALSLCLSIAQPFPVIAQVRLPHGEAGMSLAPFDGKVWEIQTCAEDPTQVDCPPADPNEAEGGASPPEEPAGEAVPEPQADAPPEQVVPEAAAPTQDPPAAAEEPAADAPAADVPVAEDPSGAAPETVPAPEGAAPEAEVTDPAASDTGATDPAAAPETQAPDVAAPDETAPATADPEAAAPVAPVEDTTAPEPSEAGTSAPVDAPQATAEEPAPAPEEPAATAEEPAPAPEEPAATAEEPAPAPEEPAAIAEEPAPAPAEPAPETAAPAEQGATQPATDEGTQDPALVQPAPEAAPAAPEAEVAADPASPDPDAGAAPEEPVDGNVTAEPLPEPSPEQEQVMEELLADPEVAAAVETLSETVQPADPATGGAAADPAGLAAVEALGGGAAPAPTQTTTQTLGAAEARSSAQDFATPVVTTQPTQVQDDDDDDGLSDLEKAGLLALGAVAVGMLINNNRVVANSGDRVVVDRGNGDLAIWKDDNANLRAPGVVETTDRYADGSTLTRLARPDGSEIVTVRDATGRVVRRELLRADGTSVPIINDARLYEPVRVSQLPKPRLPALRFAEDSDPALLRAVLEDAEDIDLGRTFSLAQVRETRQLRELAPELTGDPITFATGSSAIRPEEARKLSRIATLMRDLIAENPGEVFLVEGHTDAVGSAASNLALSDRRAESIALALSEIFAVPPENMIVQGYGERFLRVPTAEAEALNRRVAMRRITWLLDGST